MESFTHVVNDEAGLHARPAGLLVKKAQSYPESITIKAGDKSADAKRLFAVIGLCVKQGDSVFIEISGDNENEVASEFSAYCRDNI